MAGVLRARLEAIRTHAFIMRGRLCGRSSMVEPRPFQADDVGLEAQLRAPSAGSRRPGFLASAGRASLESIRTHAVSMRGRLCGRSSMVEPRPFQADDVGLEAQLRAPSAGSRRPGFLASAGRASLESIRTHAVSMRGRLCGRSSMVEPQPSKLMMWVRFPSPAPKTDFLF